MKRTIASLCLIGVAMTFTPGPDTPVFDFTFRHRPYSATAIDNGDGTYTCLAVQYKNGRIVNTYEWPTDSTGLCDLKDAPLVGSNK